MDRIREIAPGSTKKKMGAECESDQTPENIGGNEILKNKCETAVSES
jgi:hypothetical protein